MAVYQISRIQIRRGQKTQGSGMPQLASGEMAWAIDTQELYIGNGAVSEGSPAVGNTKILTDKDNILSFAKQYQYKKEDSLIQTGVDAGFPVRRSLQEKLDDQVTSADYGIVSDLINDQSEKIQHVIDNLFKNPGNFSETSSKITLKFLPGYYIISNTIKLPSFVSIEGAGIKKTVFDFTGTGAAFEFIQDQDPANPNASITFNTQPKHCVLKGFTIETQNQDVSGFDLNCVRNSLFEDIEILSSYDPEIEYEYSKALFLKAFSSLVTTKDNTFNRITCKGFSRAVYSNQDIFGNYFNDCNFIDCGYGIDFGTGTRVNIFPRIIAEEYGPRKNIISSSYFENIKQQGILISNGYGNRSQNNIFVNVGNDGGDFDNNVSSIIKFASNGNISSNDSFDRRLSLSNSNWGMLYLPEIEGTATTQLCETDTIRILSTGGSTASFVGKIEDVLLTVTEINSGELVIGATILGNDVIPGTKIIGYGTGNGGIGTYILDQSQYILGPLLVGQTLLSVTSATAQLDAFRVPLNDSTGVTIPYLYESSENNQTRFGVLDITVDRINQKIQLVDNYDYSGGGQEENLVFYARLENNSLVISYKNSNLYNQSTLKYSYKIIS